MIIRRLVTSWLSRLVVGVVLLISSLTAWAHPLSEVLADPEGRARAVKFTEVLGSTGGNTAAPEFRQLFLEDPRLSKRAFVALLDYIMEIYGADPEGIDAPVQLAAQLAAMIGTEFGDPVPGNILAAFGDETRQEEALHGLISYLNLLRGSEPVIGSNEALGGLDEAKAAEIVLPFVVKLMRIQYATAIVSPELIISELDSYPVVERAVEQALIALGISPEEARIDPTGEIARILTLRKLVVQAEIGLLGDFEKNAQRLLEKEEDAAEATFVCLTGFRAAYRQQRVELAEQYLQQAQRRSADGGIASDRLLRYCLLTADFQLRRLKGHQPSEKEIREQAMAAWAVLDGYEPKAEVEDAYYWYYGRQATRYWVDELRRYPDSARSFIVAVAERLTPWADEMSRFDPMQKLQAAGATVEALDELFGYLVMSISLLDQLLYGAEALSEFGQLGALASMVADVETTADGFAAVHFDDALVAKGEGFPPFEVSQGGVVPELRARARYLSALTAGASAEKKLSELQQAVEFIRKTKNPEITVDYLIKIGVRLVEQKQHDQAVALWKEALSTADELSFVQRSLEAASLLAKEYSRRGDWKNAALYAQRANDKIQDAAPMAGVNSQEGQLLAQRSQELTAISMRAAMETNNPEMALATLTRSQQVQSAAVQMEGRKDAQAEAREVSAKEGQVVALAQEVRRLEAMPASQTRDDLLQSTQGVLADTRSEFLSRSRELRRKYSELYSKVLRFDPLNLPEIQKSLPADLAVVQYFPTDDALYIFLVTGKEFRLHTVAVAQRSLDASVSAYLRAMRRPGVGDAILAAEGAKLYQALIAPVESDIAASKTLVLIPSGRLNSVPFASLPKRDGTPLVQDKEILELAKSTDLMRLAGEESKPITSLVAFANATGDLPAAAKEGQQIANLFPSSDVKLFQGKQATREAFVKFGAGADALHLATHGEWNIEDSLGNYLAMANEQKVSQDEIFELGLENTSIVILSACNTAMGDGGDVKYVASLAEAFWIAGSRSVVASLWAVNDESTSLLMTEFYKALKAGDNKAAALRKAQLAVRSDDRFSHPYYWSAFILFGDWR